MRVELPSGGWVEVRDKLMAKDRFDVQDAITFTVTDGKQQKMSAGMINDMRNALLTQTITEWSFDGMMLPSQARVLNGDRYDASEFIGTIMDIDDYNALSQAVEPLMDKVNLSTVPNSRTPADA